MLSINMNVNLKEPKLTLAIMEDKFVFCRWEMFITLWCYSSGCTHWGCFVSFFHNKVRPCLYLSSIYCIIDPRKHHRKLAQTLPDSPAMIIMNTCAAPLYASFWCLSFTSGLFNRSLPYYHLKSHWAVDQCHNVAGAHEATQASCSGCPCGLSSILSLPISYWIQGWPVRSRTFCNHTCATHPSCGSWLGTSGLSLPSLLGRILSKLFYCRRTRCTALTLVGGCHVSNRISVTHGYDTSTQIVIPLFLSCHLSKANDRAKSIPIWGRRNILDPNVVPSSKFWRGVFLDTNLQRDEKQRVICISTSVISYAVKCFSNLMPSMLE